MGVPQNASRKAFTAFFKRLGTNCENLVNNTSIDVYADIRCGLAHAYLIEGRKSTIKIGPGPSGREYDQKSDAYTFYISTYFADLRGAVDSYISGLEGATESLKEFRKCS